MTYTINETINGYIVHLDDKNHLNPLADAIGDSSIFGVLETRWQTTLKQGSIYLVNPSREPAEQAKRHIEEVVRKYLNEFS